MKTFILTLVILINIFSFGKTQSLKPKQGLYFLVNPNASYISNYKKISYPAKFDLEIRFNTPCLVIKQMPYFYKYRDSVKFISKRKFYRMNYNILPYNKFINIICKEGNDASLLVKYNIYFVEEAEKDKFLLYKVLYSTPVPDDRHDNIITGDKNNSQN